jgi:hypothetical protein
MDIFKGFSCDWIFCDPKRVSVNKISFRDIWEALKLKAQAKIVHDLFQLALFFSILVHLSNKIQYQPIIIKNKNYFEFPTTIRNTHFQQYVFSTHQSILFA